MRLPDWRDPAVFVLLIALVVAVVATGVQWWQLRDARAEIVTLRDARDDALRDSGALQVQRDEAATANANMARRLDEQSRAVAGLRAAAEAREAQAGAAARRVLAEQPKLPNGHGPSVMNAWLRDSFSSR